MQLGDANVQLSAQRLRELMLWHGKDEGNLPPAATLVNLSRDTIAALSQLQHTRTELAALRADLAQLFWTCDSSAIRLSLLAALGAPPPPHSESPLEPPIVVSWAPARNGLQWAHAASGHARPLEQGRDARRFAMHE
ncbi:MAG TPA: hypothetical protein VK727_10665 [Steroidobacteraceae bacterium]|jgi:hypothetical protein|nr:hypothetical protein [Steroidobacteraceae bacterium]